MVGRATSGNYGPRLETSFVLAMVPPELAAEGTELEMDVLGTLLKVTVVPDSPFDPENERLRA
jgi:dimethylglycine dehydrogenase